MQAMTAGKVKGIDVSHHNGSITWSKVKAAGYQFVYIKATEGQTYTDPTFLANAKNAKAAGMLTGAYHFARPDSTADAVTEAKYFVSVLQKADTDLLPCLDLEASKLNAAQTATWVDTFISFVKSATGKNVMIYTGLWFMNQLAGLSSKLAKYPLWVSYYKTSAPPNNGWTSWTMWQYTDSGNVPGIAGGVDLNVVTSLDEILATKPVPTPSVSTTPDMYDLSYLSEYKLIPVRSSKHPNEINEKVTWAMEANANCVLLLKRGFDLRELQKALSEMYPESK